MIRKTLILSLFLSLLSASCSADEVEKYIENYGLKKSIAQMFVVGIPVDYKNASGSSELNKLISEMNIGGVMLNNYNLPSTELKKGDTRELALTNAVNLIHNISMKNRNSSKTPVFIYADFEGYGYSSIHYPLTPPPNPLVLASTGDVKLSYYAGLSSGYQLKALGVDVVLGPVLDLDHGQQGDPNLSISLRSFSESRKIMLPHAQAYLNGLSDSHIIAFAKHFPSYSHVYENAHKEQPVYTGSMEIIQSEIQSFEDIKDSFSGIMTSHLIVKTNDKNIPVTYNKNFLSENILDKNELSKKIIITDDLSNMVASKTYITKRYKKFSYAKSAENAFKAGHDLLLFSHISGNGTRKHSDLTIKDIEDCISAIENVIIENPLYKKRFKESLKKIIQLKMQRSDKRLYHLDFDMREQFSGNFNSLNDYLKKTYSLGVVKISEGKQDGSIDHIDDKNKLLVGSATAIDIYKIVLDGELSMNTYVLPYGYKNHSDFKAEKEKLIKEIEKSSLVYMAADNIDHINLIDFIRLRNPILLDKIIVFLHTTPHMINMELLNSVAIYGNFSKDPKSYEVDVEIIRGDLKAKPISYLPISIGNGGIHDSKNTIPPTKIHPESNPLVIFETNTEREYHEKIMRLEFQLKEEKRRTSKYKTIRDNLYTSFIPLVTSLMLIATLTMLIFRDREKIAMLLHNNILLSTMLFVLLLTAIYYSNIYPELPVLKEIYRVLKVAFPYGDVLPNNE
ncbi:glycoside hydrolase family 3 N-terminal domain-containing protein [Aeromonas diversa]|uniref:glycoside hydrolase family 3 N-terminal domain-containing protein n=1 Tax=Aeromonas diversa TaxID=502790 RepID=UPI0039A10715